MRLMQVFDCQDMPQEVRKDFFENTDHYSNDCFVSVHLGEFKSMTQEEYLEEYGYGGILYMQWLLDNGAVDNEVLVNHWW